MSKRALWISSAVVAVIVVGAVGGYLVFFRPAGLPPKEIVLGAPLATGFLYGSAAEKGLRLAIEEINAMGGVRLGGENYSLRLVVYDTRDLLPTVPTQQTLADVDRLITDEGADIIIGGPVRSEAANATMGLVSSRRVVHMLTTGALSPVIHTKVANDYDTYKYTFRITSEVGALARDAVGILEYLRTTHGFNSTYIMVQDVAHARAFGAALKSRLDGLGTWRVWPSSGPDIYSTGATDYKSGLNEAKELGAQTLFIWMDHPQTAILMRQWSELQIPALPVTGINSAMEDPDAWNETDGQIQNVIASPVNTGNAISNYGPAMTFFNAFKAKWDVEPEGYGAVSSYAAVYVLKAAIERAGSLDADALIAALEATDYMGPYGRIQFNPTNHQVIPSDDPAQGAVSCWFQWQDGFRRQVWPRTVAVADIRVPEGP